MSSHTASKGQLFISPFLFFLIRNGKIIVWDFKNHQQFELDSVYFGRLLELSNNLADNTQSIDQELLEGKLVSLGAVEVQWEWDILSQIFHFGTSIVTETHDDNCLDPEAFIKEYIELCERAYLSAPLSTSHQHDDLPSQTVKLPVPDLSKLSSVDFLSVLKNRKTYRSFLEKSISLELLSTLLYVVFGDFHASIEDYKKHGFEKIGLRKTSPSGGGIHPTEAYIVVNNVTEMESGVYYYSPTTHTLKLLNLPPGDDLTLLLCNQYFVENLPLGIFLTSRFDKIWKKYLHSRAYRIALFDIGHISQTFQLTATALGLSPWLSGAFSDEGVAKLLKINNIAEQVLFFVGAGYSDGSVIDRVAKTFSHTQRNK